LGIRASINPRITYFFSKNLYMFAEMSFTMLDISRSTFTNPATVPQSNPKDRQTNYTVTGIKDRFEFRVGLGYKF
jgi:predicted porin